MTLVAASSSHPSYLLSTYSYEWPELNENYAREESSISEGFFPNMARGTYSDHDNFAQTTAESRHHVVDSSRFEQCVPVQQRDVGLMGSADANSVLTNNNPVNSESDATASQDSVSGDNLVNIMIKSAEKFDYNRFAGARPKEIGPKQELEITRSVCKDKRTVEELAKMSNGDKSARVGKGDKKKKRKVREKTTRKWKPLDVSQFGFHDSLSDFPPLDFSCEEETLETNCAGIPEYSNEQDDAAFFESMGLDIHNDCCDDDFDDIMDWDGVPFANDKPVIQTAYKKPKEAINKSSTAHSPTLSQVRDKCKDTQTDDAIHLLHLPTPVHIPGLNKSECYKLFELECSSTKKIFIRPDRHRRVQKAHKAVKSKNCSSIFNNKSRKSLYMHHRLIKMHNLYLDFRQSPKAGRVPPMPKYQAEVGLHKALQSSRTRHDHHSRPAPAQNLKHVLHETNRPNHLETDLTQFLISLQHREMTPEDYDMLLRLDDSVKPKTVSKNILNTLKTETVGPNGIDMGDSEELPMCTVCMEPYIAGQVRKFLPCGHSFHSNCIDTWLTNSSMNCPLDGLPVEAS